MDCSALRKSIFLPLSILSVAFVLPVRDATADGEGCGALAAQAGVRVHAAESAGANVNISIEGVESAGAAALLGSLPHEVNVLTVEEGASGSQTVNLSFAEFTTDAGQLLSDALCARISVLLNLSHS